ncbi:MAG: penicillin-binding transpeptidase domain-containing protein, partial [Pyrinomonadaceae bacterium]
AKHIFSDHHTGTMSYSEALAHSSNICAIKTGMRVGREDFFAMIGKMGFGSRTGIELPAETGGIVRPVEKWNGDSLASMSIGYEIGVTALQMVSAFATIANNGIRNQPHIIKEIRRSDEQPKIFTQVQQTQVVTAETSLNLRTMLKQVILTGTGRKAQLNGYTAAGKTGTAWKFNEKSKSIDPSKYISSFIGMAPADNPEVVIAVVMDEPKVGARDGGMVSAPVFQEIAQNLLSEMKVPTDAPFKQETLVAKNVPEVVAKDLVDKKTGEGKPMNGAKSKISAPPTQKEKSKYLKKTNDKKFAAAGKLTALLNRRFGLTWIDKTKLET